jgi:23S rRNA (adenine2503-C2)-methyltransferase
MMCQPPGVLRLHKPSLLSQLPEELAAAVAGLTDAEARRIVAIAHRQGQLPSVTPAGVRRAPMAAVRERFDVPGLRIVDTCCSSLDPFVKYAFEAPDGAVIEAVRIPLERPGRIVVCVSSQVGCGIGCAFCGTGRMGLGRNLEAWEIIDQVRLVRAGLPPHTRIHGVVFQGMGEPLANVQAVIRAVRVMCNPSTLAIDARNITVCTSGFTPSLATLLRALPNVRLAISIGSALPGKRQTLIPLEKSCPLAEVLDIVADHARSTRIAPMFAWTLLGGVNDGDDEIDALSALIDRFVARAAIKPRISLLRYNPIGPGDRFEPADPSRTEAFRSALGSRGIPVVRRYSGGSDIAAACGQLGSLPRIEETEPRA